MTKKKQPFSSLTYGRQYRKKKNVDDIRRRINVGIDTETNYGYARTIAFSNQYDVITINCLDDVLKALSQHNLRTSFNWFFNIRFDFEALMKWFSEEDLRVLDQERQLIYDKYKIWYLPKKFFAVSSGHNTNYFYDLAPIYGTSLDDAVFNNLGLRKTGLDLDKRRMNTDQDYFIENIDKIKLYNKDDAVLTGKLADNFIETGLRILNFYPNKPFSPASITKEYFLMKCNYFPMLDNFFKSKKGKRVVNYAYDCYYGARVEIIKKGYFENVYNYDIKSAYPYVIANLPDMTKGSWLYMDSDDVSNNAYEGFYHCLVYSDEPYFSPFLYRDDKILQNIYANGLYPTMLTKGEIINYREIFDSVEILVLDGVEWFNDDKLMYPFKKQVMNLFKLKESAKIKAERDYYKLLLNSFYGKMIQQTYKPNFRTSNIWNPIYGCLITANTRIKLLKFANEAPQDVILFATDSISTLKEYKIPDKPKLGDFTLDGVGNAVFIAPGIYEMWNNAGNTFKFKFRGHNKKLASGEEIVLRNDLKKSVNSSTLYHDMERPYHLGESLKQESLSKQAVNVWRTKTEPTNLNTDLIRNWLKDFDNGRDFFTYTNTSTPFETWQLNKNV